MKKTKVIIPALGLLVLSTAASVSGTVAWFSMNTKVGMSGMSATTQVSSNLMIAASTAGTGTAGENSFASAATQAVTGLLEPVSTVNGVDFFYTVNAKADGDATTDSYVAYDPASTTAFNSAYGTTGAVGYIDYVFELKAINTDISNAKYINLNKLDLVYNGASQDPQKAFRVALFVQEGTVSNGVVSSYAALGASATCILDITGAENQEADKAVSAVDAAPTSISIMATNALTSLSVPASSTKYYKITQRLYLEGEDKTCTNATFLPLTSAWNLFTRYELAASNTASKTEISKFAAKTVALNTVNTVLYCDGTNLFKVADFTQVDSDGVIPSSAISADELTALNNAFGSSFTRA